ncbi:S-protein 3 [Arabidopsis thaliana]
MKNILKTQVHVVVIYLLIQIAFSQVKTDFDVNWSTSKMVRITNRLGDGLTLNLHCKSADDDLGLKILAPNGSWSLKFRTSIVGTTLFYCHFTWPGQSKRFDIYDDDRDGVRSRISCINCIWDISIQGPCMFSESDHAFNICYDWNGNLMT